MKGLWAPVWCKYSNEPYDIVIEQYYGMVLLAYATVSYYIAVVLVRRNLLV